MSKNADAVRAHVQIKILQTPRFGPLLEDQIRKRRNALRRKAYVQIKKSKNTQGSGHFWKIRCGKSAWRGGATIPSENLPNTPCTCGRRDAENLHAVASRNPFPIKSIAW